jgi:hypothetical protein
LRPLSEEGDVNKRRVVSEKRLAASDSNIEKDISRSGENGISRKSKDPKGTCLGDALTSANTHTFTQWTCGNGALLFVPHNSWLK